MNVSELYAYMEQRLPRSLSASFDNDGLACAPLPQKQVKRVLVSLDATAAAVEYAVTGGFDVLLTHHPLLFRGIKELTPFHTVSAKLLALARGGVAAMAFHTRLDAASGGVNDCLAALLGVKDTVPFGPDGEPACGRIGNLATPVTAAAFAALAKEKLNAPAVLLAGEGTVSRVALLGGEGGDYVEAARAAGADLFLSGRIGYHRMLDGAEEGIVLVEAGHYATELPICTVLADLVRAADPTVTVELWQAHPIQMF